MRKKVRSPLILVFESPVEQYDGLLNKVPFLVDTSSMALS
jgi:hypothetical protein